MTTFQINFTLCSTHYTRVHCIEYGILIIFACNSILLLFFVHLVVNSLHLHETTFRCCVFFCLLFYIMVFCVYGNEIIKYCDFIINGICHTLQKPNKYELQWIDCKFSPFFFVKKKLTYWMNSEEKKNYYNAMQMKGYIFNIWIAIKI